MNEMAVLVCSCDKYKSAWQPMFELFFKFWNDCPYRVYLMTNNAVYTHERVTTVCTGDDVSWSKSFKKVLEFLKEKYVLVIMEDYFLQSKVKNEDFDLVLDYIKKNDTDCFRIFPTPPPDKKYGYCGEFMTGIIAENASYRVSLQAGIWKREYLLSLIDEKESAWQFEHMGSKRSSEDGSNFISVWEKSPRLIFDYYCTGIIQGYWIKEAVELCRKNGIEVDMSVIKAEPFWVRTKRILLCKYLVLLRTLFRKTKWYDVYRNRKYL
ncbi:MAG: hypothetical protein IJU14_05505 [Clostridia bacterium]|nr:hypothetical protein [Clostridia bacterium]